MDRRVTLALVVILALLGGYIWYTFLREGAPPVTAQTPVPTTLPVLSFQPDQVTGLEVDDLQNKTTIQLTHAGDKWTMQSPAQGDADETRIGTFLFDLSDVTAHKGFPNASNLKDYGLSPASYQVKVTLQSGSPLTIQIGAQNPDKNNYYALKSGDSTVYLIPSTVGDSVKEFSAQPPYTPTATETPGPTDTEGPSPTDTPEGTEAPTETPTPAAATPPLASPTP